MVATCTESGAMHDSICVYLNYGENVAIIYNAHDHNIPF